MEVPREVYVSTPENILPRKLRGSPSSSLSNWQKKTLLELLLMFQDLMLALARRK